MATGTNGIATRANANSKKSGSYSSDLNRCITAASARSVGFTLLNSDRYNGVDNAKRLVRYSDLQAITYTCKLRFSFDGTMIVVRVQITFDCEIYDINKTLIGTYTISGATYTLSDLEADQSTVDTVYSKIQIYSGNARPEYIRVKSVAFKYSATSSTSLPLWKDGTVSAENIIYTGSLPGSSGACYTLTSPNGTWQGLAMSYTISGSGGGRPPRPEL